MFGEAFGVQANEVYTALMRKLGPAAKEQLREQQRGWLKDREAFVENFGRTFDILTETENCRIVLDAGPDGASGREQPHLPRH